MAENSSGNRLFGLSANERSSLLKSLRRPGAAGGTGGAERTLETAIWKPDPKMTSFEEFPALKQLRMEQEVAKRAGILNPFFLCHDGIAKAETSIGGVKYLNFSTYDYLDLNGHPALEEAAIEALRLYGTSASASRLVSGERPPHRALEKQLADIYDAEDCIVYVSGHATNVSTIGKLFGPQDVIFHDQLSHNSIVMGSMNSGAKRISYPHNDMEAQGASSEGAACAHRHRGRFLDGRQHCRSSGAYSSEENFRLLPHGRRSSCFRRARKDRSRNGRTFRRIAQRRRHVDGDAFEDLLHLRRVHRRDEGVG